MGFDDFSRTEYDQLVSDVGRVISPPRSRLIVTLPIPRQKRPRESKVSDSSSEGDEDDFRQLEVLITVKLVTRGY